MLKKRRILFIVPLPPPVHGSSMMCDYIRKSQQINTEYKCDYINLSTSHSINEIGKGGFRKLLRMASALWLTFWKLLTHRYDLCYIAITCHGNGFLKDAPFALLCKLFGRKLVIHQHNKGMSRDLCSQWRVKLLKAVYNNSIVILLSWRLYPDIEAIVRREQVLICPNGIPEEPMFKVHKERNNTIPQLLFLSNLIPSKGVYILLDALKILKERGYLFICHFVGGESKEISAEIFNKSVKNKELDGIAVYLGKKYGELKNEILSQADIFVFPTYYDNECFPLVLLEAMQAGLPCISTNEGAIPDLLDNTGFVIPRKDPIALANEIEKLLKDKTLYNQLSQEALIKFHSNYTLHHFEQNILKCIEKI